MPKASDYSKSLIYKIEHLDNPELCYVGSTVNLVKRKYQHKSNYNNEKSEKYNLKIYRTMRENGGWEAFKIAVIKEYPCKTKIELEIEEEKCRKELQANLNSHRCHITKEEEIEQKKEYSKTYRLENLNKLVEQKKNYYENNKENNKEKTKEYYNQNKEQKLEYQKNYYENNKEKIVEYRNNYCKNNKEKIAEKHKKK